MSPPGRVAIHYRRLPDRVQVYDQRVVCSDDDVVVTLSEPMDIDVPLRAGEDILLEPGSLAVWFTFPGAWHDIGRFHLADGTFTGVYANILTPPVMDGSTWHTTDLFLDVWWPRGGSAVLLDEAEFEESRSLGHMTRDTARRARHEADRLMGLAGDGTWPPAVVDEWTLERSLERLASNR